MAMKVFLAAMAITAVSVCVVAPFMSTSTDAAQTNNNAPSVTDALGPMASESTFRTMAKKDKDNKDNGPPENANNNNSNNSNGVNCVSDAECGYGFCHDGRCTCAEGWCPNAHQECTMPRNEDGECPAPGQGQGCDAGYMKVDGECVDIDECSVFNGGCEQVCNNLPGSFECACNENFELNEDGVTCDAVIPEPAFPSENCRIHIDASVDDRDVTCHPGSVETVRAPHNLYYGTHGGKPAYGFYGFNDFGRVRINNSPQTGMTAAFALIPNYTVRGYHNIFDHLRPGVNHGPMAWFREGTVIEFNTRGGVSRPGQWPGNNWYDIFIVTFSSADGVESIYVDRLGAETPLGSNTGVPPLLESYELDLFNRNMGQRFRGVLGELIYWDRPLSAEERQDVFDYLVPKWKA